MLKTPTRRRCLALLCVLFLLCATLVTPQRSRADGAVQLLYFYDPNCSVCEQVHREVLDPLVAEYGARLQVEERNIAGSGNFDVMLKLEQEYKVMAGSIPEVFIGQDALIGADAIRAQLRERIEHYLAQGGQSLPANVLALIQAAPPPSASSPGCYVCGGGANESGSAQLPTVHIAYFYQPGCDECERSERDLQYVQQKHFSQVLIRYFDIKEEAALNQYLCDRAQVPADKHLTAPALFVGDKYLVGDSIRVLQIEAVIAPYLSTGAAQAWSGWEAHKAEVEQSIAERFRSFGILTVVGAGLLDGVNPCAFATMIFLVSYLSMRKRKGRELLATGGAFTLGVFLTYLGVGFGLLKFLASLPFLNAIGKWVYGATALLCLVLAWGSIADYRKAKAGRLEDMSLKLPERMRGWTKTLIREGTGARYFVLSAFGLGFGVSVVELACTGQVYLPTIIYVLGVPALRTQASLALLLYNVMFILPLIGVFLLVYFGTTSQQLIAWMTKHTASIKLGTAALFLLLAGWLIYSIVAL
jgi:cytochrome c biogenesis protein CcdA/thiol-disulfide isomerase/thioredoxin